jgi:hypothetical protein
MSVELTSSTDLDYLLPALRVHMWDTSAASIKGAYVGYYRALYI